MKKFLALALICAVAFTSQAKKAALTDEQKALTKDMLAKYDTNKDGVLQKDEIAKMSAEDKAAWKKAFPHKKKGGDAEGASTNSVPAEPTK